METNVDISRYVTSYTYSDDEIEYQLLHQFRKGKKPDFFKLNPRFDNEQGHRVYNKLKKSGYFQPLTLEDFVSMYTLPQLKEFCRSQGLSTTGKKADLVQSLIERVGPEQLGYTHRMRREGCSLTGKGYARWQQLHNAKEQEIQGTWLRALDDLRAGKVEITARRFCGRFGPDSRRLEAMKIVLDLYRNNVFAGLGALLHVCALGVDEMLSCVEPCWIYLVSQKKQARAKTMTYFHLICRIEELILLKQTNAQKYLFRAVLCRKTCPVCGALDGKWLNVADIRIGENYPPLHEGCRCDIGFPTDFYSTRIGRDPQTGKWGSQYSCKTTWEQWNVLTGRKTEDLPCYEPVSFNTEAILSAIESRRYKPVEVSQADLEAEKSGDTEELFEEEMVPLESFAEDRGLWARIKRFFGA